MTAGLSHKNGPWERYFGPNLGYVYEQYEQYLVNPDAVDARFREWFEQYGPPPEVSGAEHTSDSQATNQAVVSGMNHVLSSEALMQAVNAAKLADHIRMYGHLAANIDPLGVNAEPDPRRFEPEAYGLTREGLQSLPASLVWSDHPAELRTAWDAIQRLKQAYTSSIAYDFGHVHDVNEKRWLREKAEQANFAVSLSKEERLELLRRLMEVEHFEKFLHKTFVGAKRFSIEGNDALVPMLDEIVRDFARRGTSNILMGMAHRGRLNVLTHVLGKPYAAIFNEFMHAPNKDQNLSEGSTGINFGWTGDVKYHLGADRNFEENEYKTTISLANNPSHLEFVNPVVEGFARAAQEDRSQPGFPVQDTQKAVAILMHGDAAFPGEGIVAETLNFNKLRGYQNGGTIHFIVNNRIGFTTESEDSRSTLYASDLAKGYEIPIIHVNADDPDACIAAARMAFEYRDTFKKDFLIDLIGYRRHGHNEMDDPTVTNPKTYEKVHAHKTVYFLYIDKLKQEGVVTDEIVKLMQDEVDATLQGAYDQVRDMTDQEYYYQTTKTQDEYVPNQKIKVATLEQLKATNSNLLNLPADFKIYPKLERILRRRESALDEGEKVEWATAEALAFATILENGQPIRISGQDSERGTFAHRHLMLHDYTNNNTHCPMHHLPTAKASFAIHNSPLSEAAVLGFEYGYNVFSPETLVIWEAQFGDFVNTAQVIIDQFIVSGRAKWHQYSNMVMLLPHGYEGQGPEHSSARLERFLQLSADNNWTVAYLSSAAQYFHLLRHQASIGGTYASRPLIVMSPKSLLRNPRCASPAAEFVEGSFKPILEEPLTGSKPTKVNRIVLCTGKISLELQAEIDSQPELDWSWLHIIRVEQLYPFPAEEIAEVFARFKNVKEIVWVQEEPKNMGSWTFMESRLRAVAPKGAEVSYRGRVERSSPSSGYADVHSYEQRQIIEQALNLHHK
ncbi:2-oxoglutarate dehydrogenase E1 component [Paenibacillus sp. 481]|uniref:2-oxoglutarate dehydrogenase E1 component n=1 Tax=Paenibacillus sp. 481 TaxID=2835869 RepID=UPI001E5A1D4B|nr:2-oxoglutarate dehydrogenase E1 component [Paenibacillus sp. 481]UHA72022.1 2-oxoglutarate dehydrogenase E1 component [Paenibacillus sp. 481]